MFIHILSILSFIDLSCLIGSGGDFMSNRNMDFYELYCEEVKKNEKLMKENKQLKQQVKSLTNQLNYLRQHMDEIIEKKVNEAVKAVTHEFEDKVVTLENQVQHLRSVLNNDSTNSGIPTSQTPLNKNKKIPNSRIKSGKNKGGQVGHKKHQLSVFEDDEVDEIIEHKIAECPQCHCTMLNTNNIKLRDEYQFKLIVKKVRHKFIETTCPQCGHVEKIEIPEHLHGQNQYGKSVQALALTLMNEGYVSINRTASIIEGLSHGEIVPSEGYISKLNKRLYSCLEDFDNELKKEIIKLKVMHWDDTVIFISKNRSCLRFYGNDQLAYYRAHSHKDKEGLDEDGILTALDKETVVVHDHNKVNYNEDYEFKNAECCAHLLRDLKKVVDNLQHEWPKEMIKVLLEGNVKRSNGEYVDANYMALEYDTIVSSGYLENLEDGDKYYAKDEETLLKRLEEYKENYLMWTLNDEIPFTNNTAERGLRSSKTKMKVSGQFNNIKSAEYFARIKSYIETGHRYGIGSYVLIESALEGRPYTIEQMKKHNDYE